MPAIAKHLDENFYDDEPMNRLIGRSEEKALDTCSFVQSILDQNLSFAAIDTSGNIAGLRITFCHKKELNIADLGLRSDGMKAAMKFCLLVEAEAQVYERYGVDEYIELLIMTVAREHRRKGLASEMSRRALEFLTAAGAKVIKGIYTSPWSRKVTQNFGFETLATKSFQELVSVTGQNLCPKAGEEDFAAVMAKRL